MTAPSLKIDRLPHAEGLDLPAYKTARAAGLDLSAAIPADTPVEIPAGGRAIVPTGLILAIPDGHEGQVRPRSGLARDFGVTVLNAPGTIDADYRGEVQVLLINHGLAPFRVTRGMRIAQLVIAPVARAEVRLTETLEQTPRGGGGFGSTGL
jgi:dUTP pyrophosphatase